MYLILKYPTRERPKLFQERLQHHLFMLSGLHDVRVIVSCDDDDASMNNPEMSAWIHRLEFCEVHYNPPPQTKVTAVNANMPARHWDLCILLSDDMVPQFDGYDDRIVQLFRQHFPDGDGVLHLNDGRTGQKLNTLPILDHAYYSRFGFIYNPSYTSVWVDNEFQEVSEMLGRAAYVDEVIVKHEWIGEHAPDDLHRRNESHHVRDAAVFAERKAAGFPAVNRTE